MKNMIQPFEVPCSLCRKRATLRCGQCKCSFYCSLNCQKNDWKIHKKECLDLKNNLWNSHFERGCRISHEDKNYKEAIESFEEGLRIDPDNLTILFYKASCHSFLNNYEQVIKDLTLCLEIAIRTKKDNETLRHYYFFRIYHYVKLNMTSKAIEDYSSLIEMFPENHSYLYIRGNKCISLFRYKDAIDDFTKALSFKPENPQYLSTRAFAYMEYKHYEAAILDLTQSIRIRTKKKIKFNPKEKDLLYDDYFKRAECYHQLCDYRKSISDFSICIKMKPSDFSPYTERAECFFFMNDLERSLRDINMSLKIEKNIPAFEFKGFYFQELGNFKRAITEFNNAWKLRRIDPLTNEVLDSVLPTTVGNRGYCFMRINEFKKAIKDLELAKKMDPQNTLFCYLLGRTYFKMKKYDHALKNYLIANQLDRSNDKYYYPEIFLELSQCYFHKKEFENAKNNLFYYLAVNMENYVIPCICDLFLTFKQLIRDLKLYIEVNKEQPPSEFRNNEEFLKRFSYEQIAKETEFYETQEKQALKELFVIYELSQLKGRHEKIRFFTKRLLKFVDKYSNPLHPKVIEQWLPVTSYDLAQPKNYLLGARRYFFDTIRNHHITKERIRLYQIKDIEGRLYHTFLVRQFMYPEFFILKVPTKHRTTKKEGNDRSINHFIPDHLPYHKNINSVIGKFKNNGFLKEYDSNIELIMCWNNSFNSAKKSLFQWLDLRKKSGIKLVETEIIVVLFGILQGLKYLHQNGFIHTLVHEKHVFLDDAAGEIVISKYDNILDFRNRYNEKKEEKYKIKKEEYLESSEIMLPIDRYDAPEIILEEDKEFLDFEKSDLFSVGMIGKNMMMMLENYDKENLEFLESSVIGNLIKKLLVAEKEKRIGIDEAMEEIKKIKDGLKNKIRE